MKKVATQTQAARVSGEGKSSETSWVQSSGKRRDNQSYKYFLNFENNTSLNDVQFIRHGWGKMSWKNGTLYGNDLQFIFSDQDEYIGQWLNNIQHGDYVN